MHIFSLQARCVYHTVLVQFLDDPRSSGNYILDEPEELRQQTRDSNYIIAEQDSSYTRLATTTTTATYLILMVWIKL